MNLFEKFKQTVKKYPKKVALKYKDEGRYKNITFQELSSKVDSLITGFHMFGIKKGDRVAILSENRPEWVIADLAIMGLGAISVPIHSVFTPHYVEYILNDSQCEILLLSNQQQMDKIIKVKDNLTHLTNMICFDECKVPDDLKFRTFLLSNILHLSKGSYFHEPDIEEDHVCSIVYTSGTTGEPTGVMLTHKNFISNIGASNIAIPTSSRDTLLSLLPLSHLFERTAGYYTPLFNGSTIAYAEGSKALPVNLKEIRPTIFVSVPRIFEKFNEVIWEKARNSGFIKKKLFYWALHQERGTFKHKIADYLVFKKIRNKLGGKIRLCISGSASLNDKIARFFDKVGILILEGYGLTETAPVVSANKKDKYKFGTTGTPLENLRLKISETKEILVKGPSVMKGYFNNNEKTRQAFTDDGWLKTGDMGFIDDEGFLSIIGRIKEMIVLNTGKNVMPEKIEIQLNLDEYIYQSAVFGNKQPYIVALIVPDYNEITTFAKEHKINFNTPKDLLREPAIHRIIKERVDKQLEDMPDYEKIKQFYLLDREFTQEEDELTPTLKLRRFVIGEKYKKEIESLYH